MAKYSRKTNTKYSLLEIKFEKMIKNPFKLKLNNNKVFGQTNFSKKIFLIDLFKVNEIDFLSQKS